MDGSNNNALGGGLAGFVIGMFFGNPMAGLKYGLAVGSLFDKDSDSPTYDFTLSQNTRSERLPVPVVYGEHKVTGNVIYEYQPGPMHRSRELLGDVYNNEGDSFFLLDKSGVCPTPLPVIVIKYYYGINGQSKERIAGPSFCPYMFFPFTSQINFTHHIDCAYLSAETGVSVVGWAIYGSYYYIPSVVSNLQTCIGFCEGEIESFNDVQLNDIPIDSVPNCTATEYLGTSSQAADPINPNNETFRNTAYIALDVTASGTINGSPKLTAVIQGRKVQVWDAGTSTWITQWSNSPAYCLLDWLVNTRYGCGIPVSKIDRNTFIDAADYCAELINNLPRYTLNIVLDSIMDASRSIELLLKTFGGILIYSDGLIKLKVEKSEGAVASFNMSNIVQGSFTYSPEPKRRDVPNQVWVEFIDPDNPSGPWEPAKLLIEDELDQEVREAIIPQTEQFWGVTDPAQAGRLGWLIFDYARYCKQFCQFKAGIGSINVEVGDIVNVTHTTPGWVTKKFRILSIELESSGEAALTLRAYNSNVYHDRAVQYINSNYTTLPNPFQVPEVSNLVVTEVSERNTDGTWINRLNVTFDKPNYMPYDHALIQIKVGGGAYITDGVTNDEEYNTKPLKAGDSCYIRVFSVTNTGIKSIGVTSALITLVGGSIPPNSANITVVSSKTGLLISTN